MPPQRNAEQHHRATTASAVFSELYDETEKCMQWTKIW